MFSEFNWIDTLQSSPVLMVLIACSVFTLGVAAERFLDYRRRFGDADVLLDQILQRIRQGKASDARQLCRKSSQPLAAVCARVIDDVQDGVRDLEESLHGGLSEQKLLLEKNLSILGSMAAIAPLIGLLGTVVGIMRAFHDMSATGSAAPTVVASGVAEALLTTAVGLVVAVPALLLYNHFSRKMTVILTVAENHARRVRQAWEKYADANEQSDRASEDTESVADLTASVVVGR